MTGGLDVLTNDRVICNLCLKQVKVTVGMPRLSMGCRVYGEKKVYESQFQTLHSYPML
jgi:hypothetical protein